MIGPHEDRAGLTWLFESNDYSEQWYFRGNVSPSWFAAYSNGRGPHGIVERLPRREARQLQKVVDERQS